MYDSVVIGVDGNQGGHDAASLARSLASDVAHFTLAYVGMITPVAHATNLEFELADHDDLPTMLGTELRISGDDVKSVLHQTQRAVAVAPSGHESDPRAITQIGVAVDDEPASEVAIAHAGLLAEHLHARLIPFGVVEPHPYAVGWGPVAVPVEDPASAVTAAANDSPWSTVSPSRWSTVPLGTSWTGSAIVWTFWSADRAGPAPDRPSPR